jgi:TonB family protein
MKWNILLALILFTNISTFAQQKDSTYTIYKDTINIRGYVYYDNGRPAYGTQLTSANKELQYDHFSLITITDTAGYFELKGAKVQDTIIVRAPFVEGKYFNRGARYMIITLPTPQPRQINTNKYFVVTALRRYNKPKLAAFKIAEFIEPGFECEAYEVIPEYPGGIERFYSYIQSKLSYPQQAIAANMEGSVEATFTVMKNGILKRIKITKGLGYGCDELVLQILKQCRKWNPGKFYGKDIEVNYTVSIDFKLTDK